MLPFPQVICPMEEDVQDACTAPQSKPQPSLQPPSIVTCRSRVLTDDAGRREARRRSGRLQLAKELQGAVQKGMGSSSSLTKRVASNTMQVSQSLSVKLIRIDSPLKNQKEEDSVDSTKSSSIQDQSGVIMSTGGHGSKCVDPVASMAQEEDSVTGNAETGLEAGQAEGGLEQSKPPESPSPVKQWVIGPLLQTFKSKMASFTEIVMTPVRFLKTSPSSSACSDNPILTNPSEDSDGCSNTHDGLHLEQKTEEQKGTESSIKNVDICFTSLIANKELKGEITTGIINNSCSSLNVCCMDGELNCTVQKSSAIQRLNFEVEAKVQSSGQEQDIVLFDEKNSDGVALHEMSCLSDSCTDDQVASVREGEQGLRSDLCLQHRSGTEKGTDSQVDSSSENSRDTRLSLSLSPGTAEEMKACILLRRLDCKRALELDSTPDCPRKRLPSSAVEAGLVFSEVSPVLSELREGHALKDSSGPVTHETVISVESDHLTPLKYYTLPDSLRHSDEVEEAGVRQLRFLDSVEDRQPSTLTILCGQNNTDTERECTASLPSLSKSCVCPENKSPLLEGPSSTEEKVRTEESWKIQPEEDQKADCRRNKTKKKVKGNKIEEGHAGELLRASTEEIRREKQVQRRSGRMCRVDFECRRIKAEADVVSTNKQTALESGLSESQRGRGAYKGRRITSKKQKSPVTQVVASTKRLAVNRPKNLPLDLTDGSVGNSGSDRSINRNVTNASKCRNKGKISRCPEPPNAVRADCSPCPSEGGTASLSDCTKVSRSTRVSATMTITIAREEKEGGMVRRSMSDSMCHPLPNTRYKHSRCRKRGSNPEIVIGIPAKCKKSLVVQGDFDHTLQVNDLNEVSKETHCNQAAINLGHQMARKRKHKTLCSATEGPKNLSKGLRGEEGVRSQVAGMERQMAKSEGLDRDCEIEGGILESRVSSAAELNPKEAVSQHLGKDASSPDTMAAPKSPFKNFTPLTSFLTPSDDQVVAEDVSVDGCTSCVGEADQWGDETPAPPVGGLPPYCEEETKTCGAPGLAASCVVKLERLKTVKKANEEKEPGIVSSTIASGPVEPRRGWRMKTAREQEGSDGARVVGQHQKEAGLSKVSGSGPLHARLLRSRSCPEIPLSLLKDCWSTSPCPSPPHSSLPVSILQQPSLVHPPPSPAKRTRRHTVCSVEVEREIAPLCLRKEVYPTGFSATSPSCTPLMVLASCFLSSPLAFLSQKHDGSSCSPGTSTGGSSSRDSSSSSSSLLSYPSPASPVIHHIFPGPSPSNHPRTGQPAASLSSLCSASSQVDLQRPSPRRLQREEESSQNAKTWEEEALSYSEIKQVGPVKRGDHGKVSCIRIRRAVPKPPTNLTPMGLPKPVRLKKKEFSLEEIYTNKNFQKPPEGRLETVFEVPVSCRDGSMSLISQRRFKRLVDFPELGVARKLKKPLVGTCGKPAMGRTRRGGGARGRESPALSSQELDSLLCAKLSQLDSWIAFDQEGVLA